MSDPTSEHHASALSSKLHDKNVLLGASGSVAAIRIPRLVRILEQHGAHVRVISTNSATAFLNTEESLREDLVFTDRDEWSAWKKLSDPVLHIELRKWAHVFIIAPTSANTLSKLANGLCDNLLTCVARAWPLSHQSEQKPFIIAPAMNTMMWQHPVTAMHLQTVTAFGIKVIQPISKKLACGDTGVGAMEDPCKIVDFVLSLLT